MLLLQPCVFSLTRSSLQTMTSIIVSREELTSRHKVLNAVFFVGHPMTAAYVFL